MINLDITFFIQLVNFLILLAILNLIVFRPIRGIIKQRAEKIASDLSAIEDFNSKAKEKLEEYENSLKKAYEEGNELKNRFRNEALEEEKSIIMEAKEIATKELEEARAKIKEQSKAVREQLLAKVDDYAQKVVEKVIQ